MAPSTAVREPIRRTSPEVPSLTPWWKQWWAIGVGVLLAVLVVGALVNGRTDDDVVSNDADTDATAPSEIDDTGDAPTPPSDDFTAVETEPADRVETTDSGGISTPTTTPLTPAELEIVEVTFPAAFEASRLDVIQTLTDDVNVAAVDQLVLDEAGDVDLRVTSSWESFDEQGDGAWAITQELSEFWAPDTGSWYVDGFAPQFVLTNSGEVYDCPGAFMAALASADADRDDWEATC